MSRRSRESPGFLGQITLSADLALVDLLSDLRLTICMMIGLASVLGPLLVIFGLKFGIVDGLRVRLLSDPRTLEIQPLGAGRFNSNWFAELAVKNEVRFLVPKTRSIAATLVLTPIAAGPQSGIRVELIPTAEGDPLLASANIAPPGRIDDLILSEKAAVSLNTKVGDTVRGFVERSVDGRLETGQLPLRVSGIAPAHLASRPMAFMPLAALMNIEDFRDGFSVADFGWPGMQKSKEERVFASFRIFASSLEDVASLERYLNDSLGVETYSQAAEIIRLSRMDENLQKAFLIIALFGGIGCLLSLAASLWANVERKKSDISLYRLIGGQTIGIVAFPVIQAVAIASAGTILAFGLYSIAQSALNILFAEAMGNSGELVCRLLPEHMAIAAGLTIGVAFISSLWSGWHAGRIEPSFGLTRN